MSKKPKKKLKIKLKLKRPKKWHERGVMGAWGLKPASMLEEQPAQHEVWERIKNRVEGEFPRSLDHDSGLMGIMLPPAVFLWQAEYMHLTFEERSAMLKECDKDLYECAEALVKGRGPKGHVARGFNALARSLALLSFQPGGCRCFGQHWEVEPNKGEQTNGEDRQADGAAAGQEPKPGRRAKRKPA